MKLIDRMLSRQAAADVHQRRLLEKSPAIIAPAVAARHEKRADQRQANLPAVDVAGEHEVDLVGACPGDVVGRVTEAKAKRIGGTL